MRKWAPCNLPYSLLGCGHVDVAWPLDTDLGSRNPRYRCEKCQEWVSIKGRASLSDMFGIKPIQYGEEPPF